MSDLEIMNLPDFKKDLEKVLNLRSSINKIEYSLFNVFLDKEVHNIRVYFNQFSIKDIEIKSCALTINLGKEGINLMIKHYRRELIINSLL